MASRSLVVAALALALAGCASPPARTQYGGIQALLATIPGMPEVRFPADAVGPYRRVVAEAAAAARRRHARADLLALSGGGEDGAFGAGFLHGLAAAGHRREFAVVTGVSSGALMAPFVFVGDEAGDTLRELYAGGHAADLARDPSVVSALTGDALIPEDRLGALVAAHVDRAFLDRVAAEHRRGRRLLVVTTDLDSESSVAWDMGAIASDPSPRAEALFREVLAASASVPGLFRPRQFEVVAGGRSFTEMHVDGGVRRQAYVAPAGVVHGTARVPLDGVYVVMNNRLDPGIRVTPDTTLGVGLRAVATTLKQEGAEDALSARDMARRLGIPFGIAYIAPWIPATAKGDGRDGFDTAHMRRMYEHGDAAGRSARPWAPEPPLFIGPEAIEAPAPATAGAR